MVTHLEVLNQANGFAHHIPLGPIDEGAIPHLDKVGVPILSEDKIRQVDTPVEKRKGGVACRRK